MPFFFLFLFLISFFVCFSYHFYLEFPQELLTLDYPNAVSSFINAHAIPLFQINPCPFFLFFSHIFFCFSYFIFYFELSQELLTLDDPSAVSSFIHAHEGLPLVRRTVVTCMEVLKKDMEDAGACSMLVLGTEAAQVRVGLMDRWMDRQTDRQTSRWVDRQVDRSILLDARHRGGQVRDRLMDRWMD